MDFKLLLTKNLFHLWSFVIMPLRKIKKFFWCDNIFFKIRVFNLNYYNIHYTIKSEQFAPIQISLDFLKNESKALFILYL
jgi:hypothetical protein